MKNFFKRIIVGILLFESRLVLWRHRPEVIAVTGSVGKTSTKDAIYAVIKDTFDTRRSEKSYNSEIGVPLTILGLPNAWNNPFGWFLNILKGFGAVFSLQYPEILVLEVGVGMPGDMARITRFVKPDIVVFTRLAKVPVHVEYFDSPQAVYDEKAELVKALKHDGTFVVCGDDPRSLEIRDRANVRNLTYGFDPEISAMLGASPEILYKERLGGLSYPSGLLFRVDYETASLPVRIHGTLGRQHIYSSLAAFSVGVTLEMNMVELTKQLSAYHAPPGRMRVIEGIKNSTIIDDSYNSSPVAVRALFETMEVVETEGRKIVVLGDMLELGRYSKREHKKIGKQVVGMADLLVTVGKRSRDIAESALGGGMSEKDILQFEDSREAGNFLRNLIKEGDVVAVKGSQGSGKDLIRTEHVTRALMAHPEDRAKLLVRQDEEWRRH